MGNHTLDLTGQRYTPNLAVLLMPLALAMGRSHYMKTGSFLFDDGAPDSLKIEQPPL